MSRGAQDSKEGITAGINLENDFPGIYYHLQDKRAAVLALQKASVEQSTLLLAQYRREAETSRLKLQTTIAICDQTKFKILEEHELFFKPSTTLAELLQAKKRPRYFRGMKIDGKTLKLILAMDLSGVDFGNCIFECDVDFTGCNLKGANFQGALFEKKLIVNGADLRGANFKDTIVSELKTNLKTKTSGVFSSSGLQKNGATKIKCQHYDLGDDLVISITKAPHYAISIGGVTYDSRQFLQDFDDEYRRLQKKGGFGNQIKRLEKTPGIQKIDALFVHAQEDNKSRTVKALRNIANRFLGQHTKISESRASVSDGSNDERSQSPLSLDTTITPGKLATECIEEEAMGRRLTIDLYDRQTRLFSEEVYASNADISLRQGLQQIESLERNADSLLEKYKWLKEKKRDSAFVEVLLAERIFPEFLKQVIYPQSSKILPYKILDDFFKESALAPEFKKIVSNAVFISNAQSRLVSSAKTEFLNTCHAAWAKVPVAHLVTINAIEKTVAARIVEKMKAHGGLAEPERTCVEKQYYLAVLIEGGKYGEAEREAAALRAGWPKYRFEDDPHRIFSTMIDGIRHRLVQSVETKLRTSVSVDDEKTIIADFYQACQPLLIQPVFKKLVAPNELGSELNNGYNKLFYFTNPMVDAIHTTLLMRRVAKKVLLHERPIDQDDVKLLYGFVNRPFVWIGGEIERQVLITAEVEKTGVSAMIKHMLTGAMKAEDLLKPNARALMETSHIKEEDFKGLVNVLLDVPAITDHLKKIFRSIWLEYDPIKRAVRELPNGDLRFADPDASETKALVTHPEVNMLKLRQAKKLYELFKNIESTILNPVYNFAGVRQVSIACDVVGVRESYKKQSFVVPELLPIGQISEAIGNLRKQIDDFVSDLGAESKKTFGTKLSAASEAVKVRKKVWERHVVSLIQLHERVPEEQAALALHGR